MIGNCNRWLVAMAAAYLALLGTNFGTFWKSATYLAMLLLAALVVRELWTRRLPRPPAPPASIWLPFAIWLAWSALSWSWSMHPGYTLHELKGEVLDVALLACLFYVAVCDTAAWRAIIGTSIGAFALLGIVAVAYALLPTGWNADRFHNGTGPYSTYLVQTAPLLLWLAIPAPAGFARTHRASLAAAALVLLLIADARLTSNRNVWIALLALALVVPGLAAMRWRAAWRARGVRWIVPFAGVAVILAFGFADTLRQRTELNYSPSTPVSAAIAEDPRLALWSHTWAKIEARPLVGYGTGKKILAHELLEELGDPLLTHAHNVFISQWLQKGLIGLAAFAATLLGLLAQFGRFVRSRNDTLAMIGVTGIGIVVAMVVKNLTDDFLFGNNGRQFWCLMALLLGYGMRLQAGALADATRSSPHRANRAGALHDSRADAVASRTATRAG